MIEVQDALNVLEQAEPAAIAAMQTETLTRLLPLLRNRGRLCLAMKVTAELGRRAGPAVERPKTFPAVCRGPVTKLLAAVGYGRRS
jgi:hypothetical protein